MSWESIRQDAVYTIRSLRRDRAFLVAAVLIIALGIGANTAIFSIVHGLLFRPLEFRDPERLVWIANSGGGPGLSAVTSRVSTFQEWKRANRSFEDLAGYFAFFDYGSYTMAGTGEPERLIGVGVSQNFLEFLEVKPTLGRSFRDEECVDNAPLAVILTHGIWQRRFGSDRGIVGRQLDLNNQPATVIGVLPADFDFVSVFVPGSRVEMLVPFPLTRSTDRYGNTLAVMGRLKPGVSIGSALAEFEVINEALRKAEPDRWKFGVKMTPLREHLTGRLRRGLLILLTAVGGVLLIACTNLSNLLLARASARRKEVAIRSALGASRTRLIRQMLTESLLLSGCGALFGAGLAFLVVRYVAAIDTISMPLLRTVRVDATALLFTAAVAIATGVLFGITPALQASRSHEADSLKDAGRGMSGSRRASWTQRTLVISEVALACVLLVGAGLLIRSFLRVLAIDLGFRPEHVMAWRVTAGERARGAAQAAFYDRLVERVEAVPGVVSAGVSDALPLGRDRSWGIWARGVGYPRDQNPIAHPRIVDAGYLQTMGIALRSGRYFTAADNATAEKVIIVNEKAARTLWPDRDAVGQMVRFDQDRRVIGVVADVRHLAIEQEGGLEAYIPIAQNGSSSLDLVIRSSLPPERLVASVRRAIQEVDAAMPAGEFRALSDLVERAGSPRRFLTTLLSVFAVGALLLAAIGIYGVVSYGVNQRTKEIGIRMALGASPAEVRARIVRETLVMVAGGVGIGVSCALVLSRAGASLLYQLEATDGLTFGSAAAVLLTAGVVASFAPALRASRLDPSSVLRSS